MADLICGLAKGDYPCRSCYGFGGEFTQADEWADKWERCPDCSGTGDGRPAVLRKIAAAIRQEWRAEMGLPKVPGAGDHPEDVARWLEEAADDS